MSRRGYVYGIRCLTNGKMYIGSTADLQRRFYIHRRQLSAGKHHSPHLQNTWNKHGADAFEFVVLEEVDDILFLVAREQFWMWRNEETLLNCSPTAGSPMGVRRSDEQKARMKAVKQEFFSTQEGKQHLANMHAKNRGRVMSEEERAARSVALTGKQKGVSFSEEHKASLRAAWVARKAKMPPKQPKERKPRKHSQETIDKIVAAKRAFIAGELPVWKSLKAEGKSLRDIERITGRSRDVIARELARAA